MKPLAARKGFRLSGGKLDHAASALRPQCVHASTAPEHVQALDRGRTGPVVLRASGDDGLGFVPGVIVWDAYLLFGPGALWEDVPSPLQS
jgi:hypothetical protein